MDLTSVEDLAVDACLNDFHLAGADARQRPVVQALPAVAEPVAGTRVGPAMNPSRDTDISRTVADTGVSFLVCCARDRTVPRISSLGPTHLATRASMGPRPAHSTRGGRLARIVNRERRFCFHRGSPRSGVATGTDESGSD